MIIDVLLGQGVPIAFATTRVLPRLITPRERIGQLFGVARTTAVLELEETIHVTSGEVVHHSRDLFGPGGMDLHVVRALDVERPAQVNPAAENGPARRTRRAAGRRRGAALTRSGGHTRPAAREGPGMKRSRSARTPPRRGRRRGARGRSDGMIGAHFGDDDARPEPRGPRVRPDDLHPPPVKVPKFLAASAGASGEPRTASSPSTRPLEPRVAERAARVEALARARGSRQALVERRDRPPPRRERLAPVRARAVRRERRLDVDEHARDRGRLRAT